MNNTSTLSLLMCLTTSIIPTSVEVPDVPNQIPMPHLPKQMLNVCPIPPVYIIVRLLLGRQSSMFSSNEWHNDMHFMSTLIA